MDFGDFSKMSDELCSSFLENSKYNSIVLYGEGFTLLKFLQDSMKKNFDNKGKNIEVIIDEKDNDELIKKKYSEKYLIDVDSFMRTYSKH